MPVGEVPVTGELAMFAKRSGPSGLSALCGSHENKDLVSGSKVPGGIVVCVRSKVSLNPLLNVRRYREKRFARKKCISNGSMFVHSLEISSKSVIIHEICSGIFFSNDTKGFDDGCSFDGALPIGFHIADDVVAFLVEVCVGLFFGSNALDAWMDSIDVKNTLVLDVNFVGEDEDCVKMLRAVFVGLSGTAPVAESPSLVCADSGQLTHPPAGSLFCCFGVSIRPRIS